MFKVTKEHKGEILHLTISGEIDEKADFDAQIGVVNQEVMVNCKNVDRMTSDGVKAWIKFFQDLQRREVKMTFHDCSPAIISQVNMIVNFLCGGALKSLYVPYTCKKCKKGYFMKIGARKLKKLYKEMPQPQCPVCGQSLSFDDVESEYFNFLERPLRDFRPKPGTRTLIKRLAKSKP
jgi:anti-anti-sigma regulatory factor